MLSSLVLAFAGQAPPRFEGAPVSLAPSLTERFEAIGFASGDQLLVKQTFMDSRFYVVDTRGNMKPIPETSDGHRVTNIKVQDGWIKGLSQTRIGRTAVFKLENLSWNQIGGLNLYYCSEAFDNGSGEVVGYGFEFPGNPFGVYLWDGKQQINLNRKLKLPGLKLHSFWEDGSIVLGNKGTVGDEKLILLRRGSTSVLGETVEARDFRIFSVPKMTEVILDPGIGTFVSERDTSVIFSQGKRRFLKGPAGRALRGVRSNGKCYIGSEPGSVGSDESRAVLVVGENPFYIDELVDNKEILGTTTGMVKGFQEAVDISRSGAVVVHATVHVKDGSTAKRAFILNPLRAHG